MKKDFIHKLRRIVVSLVGALTVLIGVSVYDSFCEAAASAVVAGATALNVRSGPGTEYENVKTESNAKITLRNGYSVSVEEEDIDSLGRIWYKISFTYDNAQRSGYVLSDYIRIKTSVADDGDFEAYLDAQGFPESYRSGLRQLHEIHPEWVFEAFHTNLDWTTSLDEESKVGKNLIQNSAISSWKSMEAGAYNYTTNSWVVFDGSDWVSASRELIAYYMDPRNFLNDKEIFQFETLSYDNSYQSIQGVRNILNGSFMDGNYTDTDGWQGSYAEVFIYAAEQSGVSPYHLASRCIQEVSRQGSSATSGTVSGYTSIFNFYNIGATSSSNPVVTGLKFASQYNDNYFLPWNTKWKAIAGGAIYLGTRYINVGQDTLYLQKFNVQGSNPYNHQYMTNVQAPSSEAKNMATAYGSSNDEEIAFKIPIYNNMPSSPCPLPTGSGGSVTALASLGVEGYSLSPTFHKDTFEYDLVFTETVDLVSIVATTLDSGTTVSGTGYMKLASGLNVFKVTVTAENGSSAVYTINISNPEPEQSYPSAPSGPDTDPDLNPGIDSNPSSPSPEPSPNPEPSPDSPGSVTDYTINVEGTKVLAVQSENGSINMLYGFDVGMTVEQVYGKIQAENCEYRIVNHDNSESEKSSVIATGMILQAVSSYTGEVLEEFPIIIYGDTNGDGKISGKDMLYVQRHLLDLAKLTGAYAEAADINWSDLTQDENGAKASSISARDMLYLQRHLLDLQQISQK